jgi:amino acid adenylation domain-containing protein
MLRGEEKSMTEASKLGTNLSPQQQAIRDKCFHSSGTFIEFPKHVVEQSIPGRFENIVQLYPEQVAIKENDIIVTYSELNRMANRVARALVNEHGVNAEPVGLLFGNGAPLMASILGVLKAGKFFVLLDPLFPPARNAAVLEDSQAKLLLTDKQNAGSAAQLTDQGLRLIEFESLREEGPDENIPISLSPQLLAHIAYTSGSTGEPKGVMNNHRNVLYDVMLRTNTYHISYRDKLSLIATASAHAVKNIFFALLNGATLLPFNVQKEGVIRLACWMSRERISICRVTIQLFREFCGALTGKEHFDDLRLIQFAGDSRFTSDVELWKKYFPSTCLLANGISSSESGYLTDYLIDHTTDFNYGGVMPAGYAVENKELLLLDDNGQALGFNQMGELAVRSSFLSPGYWQRPELTEAKFKPDPLGGDKRLYFTGDLAVMLPDGCLVYKGRKDFRLKIRGYGVEISEVEKALRRHEAIKDAVVVAGQHESGENRLVAYYTCSRQPAVTLTQLRSFVSKDLPDYMIPWAFVLLDSMPVTPTGKIDRQALPDPGRSRPALDISLVAPRNSIETRLARIWAETLSIDQIGVDDDFLLLGGHSLLAARIVAKVNQTFGIDLSLRSLLDVSTVAGLAGVVASLCASKSRSAAKPMDAASEESGEL